LIQVRWSPAAESEFDGQIDYIAERNLTAAVRLRDIVYRHTQMLEEMPEMGRPGRVAYSRELVIAGTSYIAVYRIRSGYVEIFRFVHGAQKYPK
jgi:toxin ParE1/3/4